MQPTHVTRWKTATSTEATETILLCSVLPFFSASGVLRLCTASVHQCHVMWSKLSGRHTAAIRTESHGHKCPTIPTRNSQRTTTTTTTNLVKKKITRYGCLQEHRPANLTIFQPVKKKSRWRLAPNLEMISCAPTSVNDSFAWDSNYDNTGVLLLFCSVRVTSFNWRLSVLSFVAIFEVARFPT